MAIWLLLLLVAPSGAEPCDWIPGCREAAGLVQLIGNKATRLVAEGKALFEGMGNEGEAVLGRVANGSEEVLAALSCAGAPGLLLPALAFPAQLFR